MTSARGVNEGDLVNVLEDGEDGEADRRGRRGAIRTASGCI